ncbi:unnamed protein product [Phytomonas sp. Hart1]|nr:unnamed protein product [Phytomonas sp. Hart1]|eukprot:CCW66812.1 unnamed protein product [Phytomonas sp. isolate Hart1]
MLRLCGFLNSSSTRRTVGRAAGASLPSRPGLSGEKSQKGSSGKIILPWCARPSYDLHVEEWKYLDRMLAGVIGMTAQEVSERSLRLVGRDLLREMEEPVRMLYQRHLKPQKMAHPGQTRLLKSDNHLPTTAPHHRSGRPPRENAPECPAEAPERPKGKSPAISAAKSITNSKEESHASEVAAINAAKAALATILDSMSKRLSNRERIKTSRGKDAKAESLHGDTKKSPLPLATLLRENIKNAQEGVKHIGLSASESAINGVHNHSSRISSISSNETSARLDLEANKSHPRRQAPSHSGMGTRKKISSRKVKDKDEISVHLV